MDSTIAHYTGVDLFGTANKSDRSSAIANPSPPTPHHNTFGA